MLIFDTEIKLAVPMDHEKPLPGIVYCDGWHDFANMGLAVVSAYDTRTCRYRVFFEDNFNEFQRLVNARSVIAGFNSQAFDIPLCAANGIEIPEEKSYDILIEIWKAAGLGPVFEYPSHRGFGLDAICEVNFDTRKQGSGALAPVLWQQGKVGALVDYCLYDVFLTRHLLCHIMIDGTIRDPRDPAKVLKVAPPKLKFTA